MAGRRRRRGGGDDNGFAEWGGYMAAKKAKLQEQFLAQAAGQGSSDLSDIFHGVAIFVNGYSVPSADELKILMMKHGGIYHHYYRSASTTHIIATNLPDTKVKKLKTMNIVRPDWIVESIAAGRLLDYRDYLLYSHQSRTQPKLEFKAQVEQSTASSHSERVGDQKVIGDENENSNSSYNMFDLDQNSSNEQSNTNKERVEKPESKTISSAKTSSTKTAGEAGFLSEFYSNSRLHHISTMGATFKQYVNQLREKSTSVFSGVEKLKAWKQEQVKSGLFNDLPKKYDNVIMHIDMDCFFVSVGVRSRPDLKGHPVAVTHAKGRGDASGSRRTGVDRKAEFELYKARREDRYNAKPKPVDGDDNAKPWSDWVNAIDESDSMSEIASCNYEARRMGLKNGMFMGQALKLCPNLKTIPYDFEGYKEVSYCLYNTVASFTVNIEAVSCDEMFVDVTSVLNDTGTSPSDLATMLRAEIKAQTGCPCSTGFGSNRLQARLATRRAKPDGQFYLEPAAVQAFMLDIKVTDLPGVGRSTSYKLASVGVRTCLDLQQVPRAKLLADFGHKMGDSLYKHCRGDDSKKLVFGQERKSVSAEVNYGIRFRSHEEADKFLRELCGEVQSRLTEVNMSTKLITLKLMVRAPDAPVESAKFLGHGVCDHVSRSCSLPTPTTDATVITREVVSLFDQLKVEPSELRGVGIQLSRLQSTNSAKPQASALDKFLRPKSELSKSAKHLPDKVNMPSTTNTKSKKQKALAPSINNFFAVKKRANNKKEKAVNVDREVLAALPLDIREEVMKEYGLEMDTAAENVQFEDPQPGPSNRGLPNEVTSDTNAEHLNLSQIDLDVLEELPIEIQQEIKASMKEKKSIKSSEPEQLENSAGPMLDPDLAVGEVRALIKAWTSCEDSPQPRDITMLSHYLRGLAAARRLDDLDICISCLHRCVEARQSGEWQGVYLEVVDSVQSVMLSVYGLRLWVPKTFQVF